MRYMMQVKIGDKWEPVIASSARYPYTFNTQEEAWDMLRVIYPEAVRGIRGEVRVRPAPTIDPKYRGLFVFILKNDTTSNIRQMFRALRRIGASYTHPDYMLFKTNSNTYERTDDPGAWNGVANYDLSFTMVRREDCDGKAEWSIHS